MSLEIWNLRAFLFGFLAGVICVGGLNFGMRWVVNSMREDLNLSNVQKSRYKMFGIFLIVGQLFAALGILWFYLTSTQDRVILPLAFGLVGSIFLGNLVFAAPRK